MSTIAAVITPISDYTPFAGWKVQWTPVTEADTCASVTLSNYSDRSIQVTGTFGGGSVACQGSNDGTNFAALTDPGQTTIAITTAGIKQVTEASILTRPNVTGGTGQSLTITMFFRQTIRP